MITHHRKSASAGISSSPMSSVRAGLKTLTRSWMTGLKREELRVKTTLENSTSETREHHQTLSPSSFPMWNKCPVWESDRVENEHMARGTMLHDQFQGLIEKANEGNK